MFRAMFSPIIRSTWLYLQYLLLFTQVTAGCQPAVTWVNNSRYCKIQSSAPNDGRKHRPKHVQPTWNNKLIYIVHLVGYFHSCITKHGFMNVQCARWVTFIKVANFLHKYKKVYLRHLPGRDTGMSFWKLRTQSHFHFPSMSRFYL